MRNWKNWIKAAGIRAIKTVAQTAVATIGTTAVMAEVNWVAVGSAAVLAGQLPETASAFRRVVMPPLCSA